MDGKEHDHGRFMVGEVAEARFKQVNGDFVFRAPGIGPHHYLVNATQKAEIQ
jgi:hypothetical protein